MKIAQIAQQRAVNGTNGAVSLGAWHPLIVLTLAFVLHPDSALADCTVASPQTYLVAGPPSLAVPRDEPIGTILWTSVFVGVGVSFTCTGTGPHGVINQVGAQPPTGTPRMPIGDSGIGWLFQHGGITTGPYNSYGTGSLGSAKTSPTYAISLVVMGPVQVGATLPTGIYGYHSAQGTPTVYLGISTPVALSALTCTTRNVTVDLKTHQSSEFKGGVGAVTQPVGFAISLDNCPAGLGSVGNPSISYQIDATSTYADAGHTVVTPSSGSSAKGVGVQILDGSGTPFQMGVPHVFSGYTGAGSYNIPLQARYYQTDSSINPGSANASLTFTISYQ